LSVLEFDSKILKVQDYIDDGRLSGRIVIFEVPKNFEFKPGQFVMIGHDSIRNLKYPDQLKWGSMSISSSPHMRGKLELVLSIGEPRGITYFVGNKCRVGDAVKMRGPFGVFGMKEEFDEAVFIATGTGIAPLMAMIRNLLDQGEKKPLKLFFGFQNMSKFLYREELEALSKKHSNFSFEIICSREPTPGTEKQGHVQDLLKAHQWELSKNIQFYICGTPQAVPDIVKLLKDTGFNPKQIHFEQW